MGEGADMALDMAIDEMLDAERDYLMDWDSKYCRYCGDGNLHWVETARGWRLANDAEQLHSCRSHPTPHPR